MKCLIIAAGKGKRLSKLGKPKPLVNLLGLTLIERVILTARKSGITDFYVVTGYNGGKVRKFLDKFGQAKNIKITHIINEEWEMENGLSVLKAKGLLNENFFLLMGDHLFDENILIKMRDVHIPDGEVILATDYNISSNRLVDIKDVTKIFVENGKIIDIGKSIKNYNAYDTGIFLCSPAIFEAIEESIIYHNESTLSTSIKLMAKQGKVKSFDIKDAFWIDVDDEKTFKKAKRCLIDKLKKPSDGPISRHINRRFSVKITQYLLKTNITPNQISLFSFILCLIASLFFFLGSYIGLAIGAVLAQISSIIDGCDGEVARLKHMESDFGRWFDAVLDRYADAFLLAGLTWYVYSLSRNFLPLFVGFLAITGTFLNSYTADKYDGLMREKLRGYYFRIGRDIRIFIIFLGALINQPFLTLLLIASLMNAENIKRIVVLYKVSVQRLAISDKNESPPFIKKLKAEH